MVVLLLHDLADVALPLAKSLSYAEDHLRRTKPRATYEAIRVAGTACFAAFIVVFVVTRNVLLGAFAWQAATTNRWFAWCHDGAAFGRCDPASSPLPTIVLVGTLGMLYPLHVFWAVLIVRMAARVLFREEYGDVRSESDEE